MSDNRVEYLTCNQVEIGGVVRGDIGFTSVHNYISATPLQPFSCLGQKYVKKEPSPMIERKKNQLCYYHCSLSMSIIFISLCGAKLLLNLALNLNSFYGNKLHS